MGEMPMPVELISWHLGGLISDFAQVGKKCCRRRSLMGGAE